MQNNLLFIRRPPPQIITTNSTERTPVGSLKRLLAWILVLVPVGLLVAYVVYLFWLWILLVSTAVFIFYLLVRFWPEPDWNKALSGIRDSSRPSHSSDFGNPHDGARLNPRYMEYWRDLEASQQQAREREERIWQQADRVWERERSERRRKEQGYTD